MRTDLIAYEPCSSDRISLASLAARAGLHPELVERFIAFGLLTPSEPSADPQLFDGEALLRLGKIRRLRRDLQLNLSGVAIALDLVERIERLEREIAALRSRPAGAVRPPSPRVRSAAPGRRRGPR
jgi:chaperone modulatory protein CbpM